MGMSCVVCGPKGWKREFKDEGSTKRQVLANNTAFFPPSECDYSKLMMETCKNRRVTKENDATVAFSASAERVMSRFRKLYHWDFLFQRIPNPKSDGVAFPLSPTQAQNVGVDYVTYKNERYIKAIKNTYDRIVKRHLSLVTLEDVRQLLTDYSWWVPASNEIRQDGAWRCEGKYRYHEWRITFFRETATRAFVSFLQNSSEQELLNLRPKVHTDHALGAYSMDLDGRVLTTEDLLIAARSLFEGETPSGAWARKITSLNKIKFAEARVPLHAFEWLLENQDRITDEHVIQEGVERMYYPVCKIAFRNNEYPGFIDYDDLATADEILSSMKTKVRPLSLYQGGGKFLLFDIDGDFSKAAAQADGRSLHRGKHRLMCPWPNNTVTPPGIYAFRLLDDNHTKGPNGFPSLSADSMSAMSEALKQVTGRYKTVVAMQIDRSNSEQYMTDNADNFTNLLYPEGFQKIRRCFTTCIMPGDGRPRGVFNGTASGGPSTSGDNMNTGDFDSADLLDLAVNHWGGELFKLMVTKRLLTKELYYPFSTAGLSGHLIKPGGLDDQMVIIGTDDLTEDGLCALFETQEVKDFCEARKLKLSLIRRDGVVRFFGMNISLKDAEFFYDGRNCVSKLPLSEHSSIGDRDGFQKYVRWSMLPPELKEDFDAGFSDAGLIFRSFEDYKPCVASYFRNLSRYGFSVLDEFNEYNATERIIAGKVLKDYDLRDTTWAKYSDEVVSEWLNLIKDIVLRSYHNE